jgi:hypothetical protein
VTQALRGFLPVHYLQVDLNRLIPDPYLFIIPWHILITFHFTLALQLM